MLTVIDETLELIAQCSPVQRWTIRTLYLAQFGDAIVPHCIEHFHIQTQADVRSGLLRFIIQSSIHLASLSSAAVTLRFLAFAVQMGIAVEWSVMLLQG